MKSKDHQQAVPITLVETILDDDWPDCKPEWP